MSRKKKLVWRFAILGFTVAAALGGYAFYLTSHGKIGNAALFLLLCPPSIGAMALDNAGLVRGIFGWILISVENAALYAIAGLVFAKTTASGEH